MQKLSKNARILFLITALAQFIIISLIDVLGYFYFNQFLSKQMLILSNITYIVLIILSFSYLIIKPKFYFEHYTYQITTDYIYVKKGYFFQTESYLPIKRVQKLALNANPFMRYFKLKTLTLLSAGSTLTLGPLEETIATDISEKLSKKVNLILTKDEDNVKNN